MVKHITDHSTRLMCLIQYYDYQSHYRQLADSGVDLDSIYNVDATKCYSNLLPRKTYKKHANITDFVNSGVHNTHRNTNHYYTLLNTVTASGRVLSPLIIVSKTHINKFNKPTYYRFTNGTDVPMYQHEQLKYYVTCTKNGNLTDVIY